MLNVGKRTPSDPMESVGRDQSPSDFIASQFARDLAATRLSKYSSRYSSGCVGVLNVVKRP